METHITYTRTPNNIHIVKWHNHSRDAIYEFVDVTKDILESFPPNSTALILQDFRDSAVPSFRMLMDAMAKSGTRKDVNLKVAYLADDLSLQLIVKSLTISNNIKGNRQFFKSNQEQDAIDWLLSS